MITRLLLLGATGDMAGRFLLPALATLCARERAAGRLPGTVQVVGAGEQDWDDARFRDHVADRLAEHAPGLPAAARAALLGGLRYRRVDLEDAGRVRDVLAAFAPSTAGPAVADRAAAGEAVAGKAVVDDAVADDAAVDDAVVDDAVVDDAVTDDAVAVYLALPPRWFPAALRALAAADLPPGSRVAVEKPFGQDLPSAVALNALLADVGDGEAGTAFRVDHILGMPHVHGLERLRAPGGPLAPVWDAEHIERVEIVWEEILGLAGRTDFFDRTGAVRDVLQNHMLQVLALVVMEPPATPAERDRHRAKADALRAVRAPTGAAVAARTRRARYSAGTLVGPDGVPAADVAGYAESHGVDPERGTETHAQIVVEVDTPRWAGTRFVLRTGKALAANRKGVGVHLRPGVRVPDLERRTGTDPGSGTGTDDGPVVRRTPDGGLWIELDGPLADAGPTTARVNAPGELAAYGEVLADVLGGGAATSVSAAEAEVAWRIVDPVLHAWAAGAVPLEEYRAGSDGPPRLG